MVGFMPPVFSAEKQMHFDKYNKSLERPDEKEDPVGSLIWDIKVIFKTAKERINWGGDEDDKGNLYPGSIDPEELKKDVIEKIETVFQGDNKLVNDVRRMLDENARDFVIASEYEEDSDTVFPLEDVEKKIIELIKSRVEENKKHIET